jgi:hypothetical protein
MQNYMWDGIKRDRLVWVGDMHPEMLTIKTVFGNIPIVQKTLSYIRDVTPLPNWMNNFPTYSLWWLIIVRDWYFYTGDKEFLKENAEYILGLSKQVMDLVNDDGTRTQLKPEDVNNYMFSSRDTDGSYLYKGVPTATTETTQSNVTNPELSQHPRTNFLQYAPVIGGALTTLASLFQKPDYTNADRVAASRRNVRRISSKPISGYLGYNPYDTNLQQTKLANQTAGAMRNVLNTSSGNRAAAMTDLLAYNARGTE